MLHTALIYKKITMKPRSEACNVIKASFVSSESSYVILSVSLVLVFRVFAFLRPIFALGNDYVLISLSRI